MNKVVGIILAVYVGLEMALQEEQQHDQLYKAGQIAAYRNVLKAADMTDEAINGIIEECKTSHLRHDFNK